MTVVQADLLITCRFDAGRNEVFEAWSDPKQMERWLGAEGFTPAVTSDFRTGGSYEISSRSPEGLDYRRAGRFLEINPSILISLSVLTCGWPNERTLIRARQTQITVTFESTKTTFRQSLMPPLVDPKDHENAGESRSTN